MKMVSLFGVLCLALGLMGLYPNPQESQDRRPEMPPGPPSLDSIYKFKVGTKLTYKMSYKTGNTTFVNRSYHEIVKVVGNDVIVDVDPMKGQLIWTKNDEYLLHGLKHDRTYLTLKLFKKSSKAGDSWDAAGPDFSTDTYKLKAVHKGYTKVQVPAGEFQAIWIQITVTDGERSNLFSYYFVPGRGLVKCVAAVHNGMLTVELENFEEGK